LQSELGITFIFVTHDQEEAMSMSDRIAIMLEGHVEQLGDPETVYERPVSAFVAGFIGRNNFWRGIARGNSVVADDGTMFVASRPEEQVADGDDALVAVRPETFTIHTTDPLVDTNMLAGTVGAVAHFGDALQYVIRTTARDVLVLAPRSGAPRLESGDQAWLTWRGEDIYVFSARQAELVMAEPAAEAAS
jgi:spermidine/putrescine transport system ATP-binding protein